jgi:hypothetical protein
MLFKRAIVMHACLSWHHPVAIVGSSTFSGKRSGTAIVTLKVNELSAGDTLAVVIHPLVKRIVKINRTAIECAYGAALRRIVTPIVVGAIVVPFWLAAVDK